MSSDKQKLVLIVEDAADLRSLYKEILVDAGYLVDEASDGLIAWNKVQSVSWDILLLDIMLPGKDGIQILKEIHETPGYKKGPIIALTNLNSDPIIKQVFEYGADSYLIKSEITPDKVLAEIEHVL